MTASFGWSSSRAVRIFTDHRLRDDNAPQRPARLPRPVAGVLFDMGGVLYDDTAWRRWLLRVLGQLGLQTNYRSFFRVWDREFLVAVHRGQCDFCTTFRNFLRAVGLSRAQIDEVEAACQARRREVEATIRPLPGVKTTLTRLRQAGLVLAALNNSEHTSAVLAERLERIGLDGQFARVVSSIDLGQTKPDPTCYRAALEGMALPAEQVAYVGHDSEELAGAAQVGMPTIAFNFDADAQADVFLARFEELADLVEVRLPYAAAG
jgi:HAD superfamily hydrolase (TIGR01509 family)